MHNQATFSFDNSGHLILADKVSALSDEDWYAYSYIDPQAKSRMVSIAPKTYVETITYVGVAFVTGCIDRVTNEVRLDFMGRHELLECFSYGVISSGGDDVWGDPTPCVTMQAFAVPVVSSGSSATTSASSSVTTVSSPSFFWAQTRH
jgi:hypothetical protein